MTVKRNIILIMLVFTLVLVTSCGNKSESKTADKAAADIEEIDWPKKPITIIVGYGAGGATDLTCRKIGEGMSEYLGVPINILNVPGGSGSIAGIQVDAKPSDGYTLFGGPINSPSAWRICDYADIGWDDFYGFFGTTTKYALLVSKNSPYKTYEDLFKAAKASSPKMKWGHSGYGSLNQVSGDLMAKIAGIETVGVPYSGGGEAATKVMAGENDYTWLGLSDAATYITSGELRAIGIISTDGPVTIKCSTGDYDVPSLLDTYPGMEMLDGVLNWGVLIKRDTDEAIVARLLKAFDHSVTQSSYIEFCESMNVTPANLTGHKSDVKAAFMESFIAWGLTDLKMNAEGLSPDDWDIPRTEDYEWPPNSRAENIKPWPEMN